MTSPTRKEYRTLTKSQVKAKYGINDWTWWQWLEHGAHRAIPAPVMIPNGAHFHISIKQMELYVERQKQFDKEFMRVPHVGIELGFAVGPTDNICHKFDRRVREGEYMRIEVPAIYRFENDAVRYFHVKDVTTFQRYIALQLSDRLERTQELGYSSRLNLWQPAYAMPAEEPWVKQMTDETIKLADAALVRRVSRSSS